MKIRLLLSTALATIFWVPLLLGQGRGSGQGQGRQGQGPPPFSGNPQAGTRAQSIGARQQQQRYRDCQQAVHRVRKRLRAMSKAASLDALQARQMQELHNQLVNDMRAMEQEQQAFTAGLTEEQKSVNRAALAKMTQNQQDLELFSEALGFELDQAALEKEKIRENIRKLDETSRTLEKQQQQLAEQLDVD